MNPDTFFSLIPTFDKAAGAHLPSKIGSAAKQLTIAGLCMTLLLACAGAPKKETARLSPEKASEAESIGNFKGAAREYSKLAETSEGAQREAFQLNAVAALIRGEYLNEARRILNAIDLQSLPPPLQARRQILAARIAYAEHNSNEILAALSMPIPEDLATDMRVEIHRLRAKAYQINNELLLAVREYIQLSLLQHGTEEEQQTQQVIWQMLQQVPEERLASAALDTSDAVVNGWITLALLSRQAGLSLQELGEQISLWRQQHPFHPASEEIVASLLLLKQEEQLRPQNIAVLLPLSTGSFSQPAAAIRDGILAAFYNRPDRDYRPKVRVYDVSQDSDQVLASYTQAMAEHAEAVIGPLTKENVNLIAQNEPLTVPTLALNYSETDQAGPGDNLYQFGLAPEDEASQVAERAWFDGHSQALVLTPVGDWGQRLLQAFRDRWERIGGRVLEAHTYDARNSDFSKPIRQLLDIDQSVLRRQKLQAAIRQRVEFVPRRRQDSDFVFIAAFPRQGRLIVPQLKFHYAGGLPVYATSHIYSGRRNAAADRDMNGVIFCDVPWVLLPDRRASPMRKVILQIWPDKGRDYQRFYALGVDAFAIIPHLKHLQKYDYERFAGQTGTLYMDETKRVHRQLLWARFKNGIATLIDGQTHAETSALQ